MQNLVNDQVNSLWYLFNTHLAAYILLGFLSYTLIGVFWAGMFEFLFPSKQGDMVFASSLAAIDIVIGFVYFIWLGRQMKGYTSEIRQYKRIITIMDIATDKLAGMYLGLIDQNKEIAHKSVYMIKGAFQFIVFYSYKIFAYDNMDIIVNSPTYRHNQKVQSIVIEADLSDLSEELTTIGCEIRIKDISDVLLNLQNTEKDPIKMSHEVRSFIHRELSSLVSLNIFNDAHIMMLNQELRSMTEVLLDIDIEHSIVEPSIFDKHAAFTLIAYFASWLPITLWIRFGFFTAIVVYPFVMFILTGPYIYRKWLGNPFSPTRPVGLVPHKAWRNEYITKIENKFAVIKSF
jgi:hypothetical protein